MDAAAQLALMAKAANVFSSDDTFLSFPVTSLSYKKARLNLLDDATYANIIEFSMITNMIPTGIAWEPHAEDFLWNVYKSILQEATFASSTRTDDEEAQYRQAHDVLSTKSSDGTINDSMQLMLYHNYQSLYENALQAYASQSGTAKSLTDPEAIKIWNEVTEPELRNNLAKAQAQWETQGYRYQVETAQAVVEALGSKSPHLTWAEWSKSFNPDIDSLTRDKDLVTVFPTSYTPASALDESSWQPFEISAAELAKLLSDAPREIRNRFNVGNTGSSIESLRFEFSSAKLLRPWFRPEVFKAQFWKFGDGRLLSDGGDPPQGLCPSYPVAVVFARKIVIKTKQVPIKPTGKFGGFHFIPGIFLKNMNVQTLRLDTQTRLNVTSKIKTINNINLPGKQTGPAFTAVTPVKLSQVGVMHNVRPVASVATIKPLILNPAKNVLQESKMVKTIVGANMQRQANVVLLNQALTSASLLKKLPDIQPKSPQNPPPTPIEDDNIFILAFVCKPVPRCPNPDENLQW